MNWIINQISHSDKKSIVVLIGFFIFSSLFGGVLLVLDRVVSVDIIDELSFIIFPPVVFFAFYSTRWHYLSAIAFSILVCGWVNITISENLISSLEMTAVISVTIAFTCEVIFRGKIKYKENVLQLEHSENRFRSVLEQISNIAVIATDQNRNIIFWNDAAAQLYGYQRHEAIGKSFETWLLPEQHYKCYIEDFESRLRNRSNTQPISLQTLHKNRSIIPVQVNQLLLKNVNGQFEMYSFIIDLRDRVYAEEKLKKSEKMFREAIELADAVPYYLNYITNSYEFMGDGIVALTGYTIEEYTTAVRDSIEQEVILLGELEGLPLQKAVELARGKEGVSWKADYRILTKDKRIKWLANAAVQVKDELGNVIGSLGILQDITDRKRMEDELFQTQKMKAIGQLSSGFAHNINNLLTGIIGNLDLAQRSHPGSIQEYLQNARGAADRAARLIEQLLIFSRKSNVSLRPTDLNKTILDVYQLIRETFDRRIELRLSKADRPICVMADPPQIHSVLMNICINARDAIVEKRLRNENAAGDHETYFISIETKIKYINPSSRQLQEQFIEREYVEIGVKDNGIGMDEETKNHIFEPFFTTKKTVGNGLGLASSYGIMKQHNGWIEFSSDYGQGTEFNLYLPLIDEGKCVQEPVETIDVPLEGNETILLVDDEELILDLGKSILEEHGFIVIPAMDGREAIDIYQKKRDTIDLIVLDLSMPYLSGTEVLEKIHSLDPHVKVIISSGYTDIDPSMLTNITSDLDFLAKPYNPTDMIQKIREVLDRE